LILGIDASNIRAGGGVTHLVELLRSADPQTYDFSKVIVWSAKSTLDRIEDRSWLVKSCPSLLSNNSIFHYYWQLFRLTKHAIQENCDLLFIPGGSFFNSYFKTVSLSQNLLPFESGKINRYGISFSTLRFLLLRLIQGLSFKKANGVIFLTEYARTTIINKIKKCKGRTIIIPHGINKSFTKEPKEQYPIDHYTMSNPFNISYISIISFNKNQYYVVKAFDILRSKNLPLQLNLIGPSLTKPYNQLVKLISQLNHDGKLNINCQGPIPHMELPFHYHKADLFIFASSCENLPNILLEAMASGLPIACSNCGPMPEILGDAGLYFDPENSQEIADTVQTLINSPELRKTLALKAFQKAKEYTWNRCAHETFKFMSEIASGAQFFRS
jgi:glycosyltransferase involved in cell wall biosynthesis